MAVKDGFIRDGGISIPGMTTKGQFNVFNTKRRYEFAITKTEGRHLAIGRNHAVSITLAGAYMDDERSITLYSAANDTIYYLGENDVHIPIAKTDRLGMASVDLGLLPQGTYTLYSSVAKDPDDLTAPYSKTVTIGSDTKRIRLMPDGEVGYWYGYISEDFDVYGTSFTVGGSSYSRVAPTINANSYAFSVSGNMQFSAAGFKTPKSNYSKMTVIVNSGVRAGSAYCDLGAYTSSNFQGSTIVSETPLVGSLRTVTASYNLNNNYVATVVTRASSGGTGSLTVSAVFLHD